MNPPSTHTNLSTGELSSDSTESQSAPAKRRRSALACVTKPCRRCEAAGATCVFSIPSSRGSSSHTQCYSRIYQLEDRLRHYNPLDDLVINQPIRTPLPPSPVNRRPYKIDSGDPRGDDGRGDDDLGTGVALLSLNAANEPSYVRAGSGHFWATVVSGSFKAPPNPLSACDGPVLPHHFPLPPPPQTFVQLPSRRTALALYEAVYQHVQSRYACLDWISIKNWVLDQENAVVWEWENPVDLEEVKKKRTSAFFVWLTYALGARLLSGRANAGVDTSQAAGYYTAAMMHLDVVIRLHNIHNVQAFLLLVFYSVWSKEGASAWYLCGMAMRIALELGMHRKRRLPTGGSQYVEEVRKRTWWGLYCIDRWLAVTLGRPLGISDDEIDQDLPSNVFCDIQLPLVIPSSASPDLPVSTHNFTSMSSALRMIRLRQIESQIHCTVDTVKADLSRGINEIHWRHMERIDAWKQTNYIPVAGSSGSTLPCLSKVYFDLKAETARLSLLKPLLRTAKAGDVTLAMAGKSAAEICQLDRSLLQSPSHSLCFSDLHGSFLTGLVLLSVVWADSQAVPAGEAHKGIRACSNSLSMYAQKFKDGEPYRDAFEELATVCLDGSEQAPNPAHYSSALSLVTAINRLDQDMFGIGGSQDPFASFTEPLHSDSLAQVPTMLDWPDSSAFEGFVADSVPNTQPSFPGNNSASAAAIFDAPTPSAQDWNGSIDDIFSQFFSANTPWNADDLAASFLATTEPSGLHPDPNGHIRPL